MSKSISLFASHFGMNYIPEYIKIYLTELKKATHEVLLIHTGPELANTEREWLKNNGILILKRNNVGHDFGSWQSAIEVLDTQKYDLILLANDSCFCIQPLVSIINWFNQSDLDFGGLINSNEKGYHIQSFFMLFKQNGVSALQKAFEKNGLILNKKSLIKKYEIGLTTIQKRNGNKVKSLVEIPPTNKSNPMFHQTTHLIQSHFPLVKKQLILNTLSPEDIEAMKSAGIYTGPYVIQSAIKDYSKINVDWDEVFMQHKNQPQ